MRLEVGPAPPASAAAWIQWAEEMVGEVRRGSTLENPLSPEAVADVRHYLEQWKPGTRSAQSTFRWRGDIDPDHLEYLVHVFFSLDTQVSADLRLGDRSDVPDEAQEFYLVLVRALLHALEMDSPCRAAFVQQLRSSWPIATAAT